MLYTELYPKLTQKHQTNKPSSVKNGFTSISQSRLRMTVKKRAFENTVRKGENAGKPAFSPFPTVFSTLSKREIVTLTIFHISSPNLVTPKVLSFVKELMLQIEVLPHVSMRSVCRLTWVGVFSFVLMFNTLSKKPFENVSGKEGNTVDQHFLHFPTMLSTLPKTKVINLATLEWSSATGSN